MLFDEMAQRGIEILAEYVDVDTSVVTTDYNNDLSAIAASITLMWVTIPGEPAVVVTKSMLEVALYMGYKAGKSEGDLSLWEDQL